MTITIDDLEAYAGIDYSELAHPYSDTVVNAVIDHAQAIADGMDLPSFATIEIAKALMDERMYEDGQLDKKPDVDAIINRYSSTKVGVVRMNGNGGYYFYY